MTFSPNMHFYVVHSIIIIMRRAVYGCWLRPYLFIILRQPQQDGACPCTWVVRQPLTVAELVRAAV